MMRWDGGDAPVENFHDAAIKFIDLDTCAKSFHAGVVGNEVINHE